MGPGCASLGRDPCPGLGTGDRSMTDGCSTDRGPTDRGSTSLVMIALVVVAATLATAVGVVGAASAAASRAQGAADASALAAAAEARDLRAFGGCVHGACLDAGLLNGGSGDPCALAAAVADEWGVTLKRCSTDSSGAVTVTVGVLSVAGMISRSARAGTG